MQVHVFRLIPGQDLKKVIQSFVEGNLIEAGWILTCVGSLTSAHIRFANQPDGVVFEGHFEIVSLTGTVSINGSHLHISISDETGKTFGGHLLDNSLVYTTAEIVIGETKELIFERRDDGTTKWKELHVRKKDHNPT